MILQTCSALKISQYQNFNPKKYISKLRESHRKPYHIAHAIQYVTRPKMKYSCLNVLFQFIKINANLSPFNLRIYKHIGWRNISGEKRIVSNNILNITLLPNVLCNLIADYIVVVLQLDIHKIPSVELCTFFSKEFTGNRV